MLNNLDQYNLLNDAQKKMCDDFLSKAIKNDVHLGVISERISPKLQSYIIALHYIYTFEDLTDISVSEEYLLNKNYLLNLSSVYFWLHTEYDIEQFYMYLISSIKLIELMKYYKDSKTLYFFN